MFSTTTAGADQKRYVQGTFEGTLLRDLDPAYDDCSSDKVVSFSSTITVGDLLNTKGVTWGWFQGGYRPSGYSFFGKAICGSKTRNASGEEVLDYRAHHNPVAYYKQFRNPSHEAPSSMAMTGQTDRAMHQYDLVDFWAALDHGLMPAVSFLKGKAVQDAHAGYSGPLDEQRFLVETLNRLKGSSYWKNMAVFLMYDDGGG